MSSNNYAVSLQLVLAHEGGYVNHPKDPGGATNKGVTQAVYNSYRKSHGLTTQSVRKITGVEVSEIYRKSYWNKVEGDRLPAGVDYAVFDYAVNSGVAKSSKDLQRVLNLNSSLFGLSGKLKVDGIIGDATIEAVCKAADVDEVSLIQIFCNYRMSFLYSLKTFTYFGKGWTRRVLGDKPNKTADVGDGGVIDYAVSMAKKDLAYPIPEKELPTVIGSKLEEVPAKAVVSDQKITATKGGAGAVLAGIGVSGNTVMAAADQVKPHVGEGIIGKLALAAFVILMIMGVGLLVWDFIQKQKEKNANA